MISLRKIEKPKCIVSGGSGFIGSHLVDILIEADWDVTVLDIRQPIQDINWLKLDIRDDLGASLDGYNYIFHLAAVANARKCSENPKLCFDTNINGTINLLNAARRAKVSRFVLASSAWVAGAQIGEVLDESSLFDISKINTIYGVSKLAQENLCIAYLSEYGAPNYTILRYGNPIGERMWKGLVVRAFIEMAIDQGSIKIMGDGRQTRDFIYVKDLCKAHLNVIRDEAVNQTYYLTGDLPISVESVAKEITNYISASTEYIPLSRIEPKSFRVNNEKAKQELSLGFVTSFSHGIKKCVDWWVNASAEDKKYEYWC